jgi:choline dehydrogenase-like flavoprotein
VIAVIGSGPAGVSAAQALAARGQRVVVFDAGLQLEPERRALVDGLRARRPEAWSEEAVAAIRDSGEVGIGGTPRKLTYGSDFPYRDAERWLPFELTGCDTRPSLARGGFSTVWGSCVLPYRDEDLEGWPLDTDDLAPHYRAVTRFMPLAAADDDLAEMFPLHCEAPLAMQPSEQASSLLRDLERSREMLRHSGLRFGRSRLAVHAEPSSVGPGCLRCGLCMHGCPYHLIYDTSATLDALIETGAVEYRGGTVVDHLAEDADRVTLTVRDMSSGARSRVAAERVYVGCGAIATTRLVLASLDAWDRPVTLRDSQYFLLPWLRARGVPAPPDQERLYSLCQLFLELHDERIDPHNVHLQVYTYNDLFAKLFDRLLGPLRGAAEPLVSAVLQRLLLIQGYLHSDSSPTIRATLRRRAGAPVLELVARANPATPIALRRVVARLLRLAPRLRALPLVPVLRIAPAGRGYHSGGSLPMRAAPGELETDLLGRPRGFDRVHVVDASVFPTIPATTITFTVMANAHRIASTDP